MGAGKKWFFSLARTGKKKNIYRLHGLYEYCSIIVLAAVVVVHPLMGRGADRPMKPRGSPHGQGGAAYTVPIPNGPRPGPAHYIFEVSRPGPSMFQCSTGSDPAHHIFQNTRPGPAHHNFVIGPARPGPVRPGPSPHDKPCCQ